MSIGSQIQKYRKLKGMTQEQLANKLGLATITIRQYETDNREPNFKQLKLISTVLGVSAGSFFQDDNDLSCDNEQTFCVPKDTKQLSEQPRSHLELVTMVELLQADNKRLEIENQSLHEEINLFKDKYLKY